MRLAPVSRTMPAWARHCSVPRHRARYPATSRKSSSDRSTTKTASWLGAPVRPGLPACEPPDGLHQTDGAEVDLTTQTNATRRAMDREPGTAQLIRMGVDEGVQGRGQRLPARGP